MMIDTDSVADSSAVEADTSTHMSDRESAHMSASVQRVEVITRAERRRRWSTEEKQALVAESFTPGASATAAARKYGIGTGLLCKWRHAVSDHRAADAVHLAAVDMVGSVPRVEAHVTVPSSKPSG
jgi:transposase-like protein